MSDDCERKIHFVIDCIIGCWEPDVLYAVVTLVSNDVK